MTSKQYLVAYVVAAVAFCALDFFWLGFVSRGFYRAQIGSLMLEPPRIGVALLFYLLYLVGIVYFCVLPEGLTATWRKAALNGLMFGLIAYATYDLTNLATLKGWSATLVVVDLAWGAFATAVAAVLSALVTRAVAA